MLWIFLVSLPSFPSFYFQLFFFLPYLVDADENDNLDATGICAVAGSGFGQEPGTFHLRVTALCPDTAEFIGRFQKFNKEFMEKYA